MKLKFPQLAVLTYDELKLMGFRDLSKAALAKKKLKYSPLCIRLNRIDYLLPPSLVLISGEYEELLDFTPTPHEVPSLVDDKLVKYLLFDLPLILHHDRAPVLLRDLSERFTRDVDKGVAYVSNILARVAKVFNTTVAVCDKEILELYDATLTVIVGKLNGKIVAQIAETNEIFYL